MSPKDQLLMAPTTQQSPLALHTASSRPITKSRPKVRIVHIFAPEIIKTDAANFRDLVQRLTGKPPKSLDSSVGRKRRRRRRSETSKKNAELPAVVIDGSERTGKLSTAEQRPRREDGDSKRREGGVEKGSSEEEEIETLWMDDGSGESSNCLPELEEIDGFIRELTDLL